MVPSRAVACRCLVSISSPAIRATMPASRSAAWRRKLASRSAACAMPTASRHRRPARSTWSCRNPTAGDTEQRGAGDTDRGANPMSKFNQGDQAFWYAFGPDQLPELVTILKEEKDPRLEPVEKYVVRLADGSRPLLAVH